MMYFIMLLPMFSLLQCVNTFTTMITKIQKDESLRYILTWLSDLLMDEEMLLFFSRHITLLG